MWEKPTTGSSGFEERLRTLRESFDLAATRPVEYGRRDLTVYLLFRVGRETFAWPTASLREIVINRKIVPAPGGLKGVHGVINYRNEVLAVINLHFRLKQPPFQPGTENILLITKGLRTDAALLVDRLIDARKLADREIKAKPLSLDSETARMIAGEFLHEGEMATLLQPESISG